MGKIDKCEYIVGEEILYSNQRKIIEQAKFTYSPLEKQGETSFGKTTRKIGWCFKVPKHF